MTKIYSVDLRERVEPFAITHKSGQLAAETFQVSKATAVRWARQLRDVLCRSTYPIAVETPKTSRQATALRLLPAKTNAHAVPQRPIAAHFLGCAASTSSARRSASAICSDVICFDNTS